MKAALNEYVQSCTIDGLHFAFDKSQTIFGQILWLILVVVLTYAGIYVSVQNYIDWKNDPVVTTISSTGKR
jgi:hypothetical protein